MGRNRATTSKTAKERFAPLVRWVKPYLREVQQMTEGLDARAPDSSMDRMTGYFDSIQTRLDDLPPEKVQALSQDLLTHFAELAGDLTTREAIIAGNLTIAQRNRRKLQRTEAGRLLTELASATAAKIPHASFAIAIETWNGVPLGGPGPGSYAEGHLQSFRDLMGAAGTYQETRGLRGEHRCRKIMTLCGAVTETLYKRYLRQLDTFLQVLHNRQPLSKKLTFAELTTKVRESLPAQLAKLVDPDIAFRRNASCHGTWRYLPSQRAVELRNEKKPSRVLLAPELEIAALNAMHCAQTALMEFPQTHIQASFARREFMEVILVEASEAIRGKRQDPGPKTNPFMTMLYPYLAWRRNQAAKVAPK